MKTMRQRLSEMDNEQFIALITKAGACDAGIAWAKQHGGTPKELFRDCPRGDWLGWYIRSFMNSLGYSLPQWAGALADALLVGRDADIRAGLVDALKGYAKGDDTLEHAADIGFNHGLTKDLNFPHGSWAIISDSADVFRRHFPVFQED